MTPYARANPFFKSSYFDINQILEHLIPLLAEHELVVTQPLGIVDGKTVLHTYVYDEDKLIAQSSIILPDLQDPQKIGSAIT